MLMKDCRSTVRRRREYSIPIIVVLMSERPGRADREIIALSLGVAKARKLE